MFALKRKCPLQEKHSGDGPAFGSPSPVAPPCSCSGRSSRTFQDAERYGYLADIMPSDWRATNLWLESTDCALERGVWLAICEHGKLVPISERAIADDPGHALLLDLWSMATHRRATLPDVARLNTLLDTIGLLALAGLLFSLRAYLSAVVLMWLGPVRVCRLDGHLAALELYRPGEPGSLTAHRAGGAAARAVVAPRRHAVDLRGRAVAGTDHADARD